MQSLDKALDERSRLLSNYRRAKRVQLLDLYADPMHGELLRKFVATLNHFSIEHADRFVNYVESEASKWLDAAPEYIRFAALEAIDNRIMTIRMKAGLHPLDDPIEELDAFRVCKEAIGL